MKIPSNPRRRGIRSRRGFSLIELLAATAILGLILAVVFGITHQISSAWRSSSAKIEAFQGARAAFDAMTHELSQATLNTYYDYYDSAGNRRTAANSASFLPHHYGRYSDLHFISGGWSSPANQLVPAQITQAVFFQAPMGYATGDFEHMNTLMDACGFFLVYGVDPALPAFLDTLTVNKPAEKKRFRLMQFSEPSERFSVYAGDPDPKKWFTGPIGGDPLTRTAPLPPVRQIAENVVALVILPRQATTDQTAPVLSTYYEYDSRKASGTVTQLPSENQLPPLIEVVMVAIDETAAKRLEAAGSSPVTALGLDQLFKVSASLETDLKALTHTLIAQHMTYRVFRTTVAIRGAKWSNNP